MHKLILSFFVVILVSSCAFLTFRTITLQSQNETADIPLDKRYLYITAIEKKPIKSIISKKMYNLLAHHFTKNGWKIVNNRQNAQYVLSWIILNDSALSTSYIPQYGDTTISSITTSSRGSADYSGISSIYGNIIDTSGDISYSENSFTNINYNQGIIGYSPISLMNYFNGVGFKVIDIVKNQEVYSFVLGVSDYSYVNDNDVVAYVNWCLKNQFMGTDDERVDIYCDINGKKVKCSTSIF